MSTGVPLGTTSPPRESRLQRASELSESESLCSGLHSRFGSIISSAAAAMAGALNCASVALCIAPPTSGGVPMPQPPAPAATLAAPSAAEEALAMSASFLRKALTVLLGSSSRRTWM